MDSQLLVAAILLTACCCAVCQPRAVCTCEDSISNKEVNDGVFYNAMLTPRLLLDHAFVGEPYSLTAKGELLFRSCKEIFTRLLRIPLAKPGQLNKSGTIVVDVVVSHRSPISPTADMDTHIMLSDGISSVGFLVHDKGNFRDSPPINAVEGLSGPKLHDTLTTSEQFRVTSDPATVHTLHFLLEPQRAAEGFAHASYDREISDYHRYRKILHPELGLYVEVYRGDDCREQFLFSFFKVKAQVQSLF